MVGKSDFNENPVVSLDLDLDFGLRLRVCQKAIMGSGIKVMITLIAYVFLLIM